MKQFFSFTLLLVFVLVSCRKERNQSDDSYVQTVKAALRDSLSNTDFRSLDFTRAVVSKVDSISLYVVRIPFHDKEAGENCVAVRTTREGAVQQGRIVRLEGKLQKSGSRLRWDGSLELQTLRRLPVLSSPVENGYITAWQSNTRTSLHEAGMLPEVVISYTRHSGGENSLAVLMRAESLFMDYGGSYWGNYYTEFYDWGGGAWGIGPDGDNFNNEPVDASTVLIDVETYDEHQDIGIEKYLKCFDNIPDLGSTCSIELFTDIPVDTDPNKIFALGTRSPGHTFIQLKKSNGAKSVIQNIGFYPKAGFKTALTNAPVPGKFVDDGQHEFNASIVKTLSPTTLQSVITEIQYLARFIKYDIDNYNCTDFALDIFNNIGYQLTIPLYDIPGNFPTTGTRMPVGVYNRLRELKSAGDQQSSNISIDFQKAYVANSSGPCN